MPLNGHVGYSKNTPLKQKHFRYLLQTHMRIVKGIMQRRKWAVTQYLYIDLNAGLGQYTVFGETVYGSPIIACTVAQARQLPMQAIFCEQGTEELVSLRKTLVTFGFHSIPYVQDSYHDSEGIAALICPGDYHATAAQLLPRISPKQFGLMYSDENGSFPPFDLLASYAAALPYLDIVIHVAASPIKLQRVSPDHPLMDRLDELLQTISKKYWLVRTPNLQHQWTFVIGTNWEAFPDFHGRGFWPVHSPEGARILRTLSFTTKERQLHEQINLFP